MGKRDFDKDMPGITNDKNEFKGEEEDKHATENFSEYENPYTRNFKEEYNQKQYDEYEDFDEDFDSEDYKKYQKKKISVTDVKEGYHVLRKQGKVFTYYIIMVVSFFIVSRLASRGIIPPILQYVLLIVIIGIALLKLFNQHKNDEDSLD